MSIIERMWYTPKKTALAYLLYPMSKLFFLIAKRRRQQQSSSAYKSKLPVIIVGNITVGGTGKTPVVEAICNHLLKKGFSPAIISRGYGGSAKSYPFVISKSTKPCQCGDEPYMLSKLLPNIPIVISPKRVDSVRYIENQLQDVNVIISDDGLQHYALARDIEIAVVDGKRGFGNQLLLPAGPLREPIQRLKEVDFTIINGGEDISFENSFNMRLVPSCFVNIASGQTLSISAFQKQYQNDELVAIAGIGNPKRFFDQLASLGFHQLKVRAFPDHYAYKAQDFNDLDAKLVVMTYKDAVKCESFATKHFWYLKVEPKIEDGFFAQLLSKI